MSTLLIRMAAVSLALGFYAGCSPVKFSLDNAQCKDKGCAVVDGKYSFNYTATAGYGKVDILIVNDNSASMSFEQDRLSLRFKNFISDLDSRHIDYRIAMTTTDISGSNGGKLIAFKDGTFFLTPKDEDRYLLFDQTIRRPETLSCEKFIADWIRSHGGDRASVNLPEYATEYSSKCPSGDERGVYAANLVVNNNPSDFVRTDSHLSIIFLSDEDERSGLYGTQSYVLEQLDQPNSLIANVKSAFGDDKYNSLSVHAIVVRDQNCLNEQNKQVLDGYSPTQGLVTGSVGNVYLTFATQGWGVSADICSSDYTGQLGQIRVKITDRIKDIVLNCSNPTNLIVSVSGNSINHTVEGKVLKFQQYLAPGTSVSLSYSCDVLN